MAWIEKNYNKQARCVFKGACNHAPATHIYFHEFTNYAPKPLCEEHAKRINKLWETAEKKARARRRR